MTYWTMKTEIFKNKNMTQSLENSEHFENTVLRHLQSQLQAYF